MHQGKGNETRIKDRAAQRALLNRVLASPQFVSASSLRRILVYLFDRLDEQEGTPLKEYEIAVDALHRPASFDPKVDPIVRVNMGAIRSRLRDYFDGPGYKEPLELQIPKGQYRLHFVERSRQDQDIEADSGLEVGKDVRRFWEPHLSANGPNILIYSELLFFRDQLGNYVRNIYVNDRTTGLTDLGKRFPKILRLDLEPSYHFVSSGVMRAVLAIQSALFEMGEQVRVKESHFLSWSDIRRANLIAIGGSRTNRFLNSLQGKMCFLVTDDCIENLDARTSEESLYRGHQFMDGSLERLVEYAVVTRRPGVVEGRPVTLVAANHGRAIEAAGLSLTRENILSSILQSMALTEHSVLPAQFQIVLRIDMIDFDEEVVNVEYVTHRAFA